MLYYSGTGDLFRGRDRMRSRLVILVAVVVATAAVIFAVSRLVFPRPGVLASVTAVQPGLLPGRLREGTARHLPAGHQFHQGSRQAAEPCRILQRLGESFQTSFAETVRRHGATTILQWDPTLASVPKIAAGGYDSYLRSFATVSAASAPPVVIGFGREMNAYWYSWGYGHLPAWTFVAAWRHIVTLIRAQHADNLQ